MRKAVVGISGGIDSSVAAYLLIKKGMTVEAVFFVLFDDPPNLSFAEEITKFLEIKLHIKDLRKQFKEKVINPFFWGYKKGITPNPCVFCNKYIKFPALKDMADSLDAQWLVTGHYARIIIQNSKAFLLKGIDKKKDQSYFLYAIDTSLFNKIIFPLGEYTKQYVKELAEKINIPSKIAEESVDVCFLREKKYYEMIKGTSCGPIIEKSTGKIIGQHRGIHLFTIGQRKRIGVTLGYPTYVVHIDPNINAIYVASRAEAYLREFYVEELNWLCKLASKSFPCEVKIRYTMNPEKAVVSIINKSKAKVVFNEPQFAPTPGQSAVFYNDDIVLGGGIIKGTEQDS